MGSEKSWCYFVEDTHHKIPIYPNIKTLMLHLFLLCPPDDTLPVASSLFYTHGWIQHYSTHYLTGFHLRKKATRMFSAGIGSFKFSLVWFRLYPLHACFLQISLQTFTTTSGHGRERLRYNTVFITSLLSSLVSKELRTPQEKHNL